jgi:hypothetical protein
VDQHERARRGRNPQKRRRVANRFRRDGIAKSGDDQLESEHRGDGPVDQPDSVLPLVAARREAVDEADPNEVSSRLRISRERVPGQDRVEPGPAGSDRKSGEQEPLVVLPDRTEAPDQQAEEARRAKRVTPKGDQRLHRRSTVKPSDMSGGVAKFYK